VKKKLKDDLRAAFDAPMPKWKNEFLLSVNFPKTSRYGFLLAQIGYIRKRVWIVTLLAVVPALVILWPKITENALGFVWVVSSLFPFIALAGITEIARSVSHNMAELEISCKFSFSSVVLARLGILGCANVIAFTIIIMSFRVAGSVDALRLGAYLLVPFLLACSLSLFVFNRMQSRESVYICGGVSCGVSIANAFISNFYRNVFSSEYMVSWIIAFMVLLICTAGEIIKLVRGAEELKWHLS